MNATDPFLGPWRLLVVKGSSKTTSERLIASTDLDLELHGLPHVQVRPPMLVCDRFVLGCGCALCRLVRGDETCSRAYRTPSCGEHELYAAVYVQWPCPLPHATALRSRHRERASLSVTARATARSCPALATTVQTLHPSVTR